MSLSLNQRICAFKKRTLKNHMLLSPLKWSILGIALTIVFVEQSVAAPPLLDANQASTRMLQRDVSFEQILEHVRA